MKHLAIARPWIAAVAVMTIGAPAIASSSLSSAASEEVRISVSYADLDLRNAAGIERLYRRLKSAASSACGPTSWRETGSLEQIANNKACAKQLLDRAVQKVDNDALTSLHLG
jgi:UrcA family protein